MIILSFFGNISIQCLYCSDYINLSLNYMLYHDYVSFPVHSLLFSLGYNCLDLSFTWFLCTHHCFIPKVPGRIIIFFLNMLTHKKNILKIIYWFNSFLGSPASSWSLTHLSSWNFLPFIIKLGIPLTLSCIKFFISWILVFLFLILSLILVENILQQFS